jgi:VIT1/CCC1 family predicted Fe2+/Mn2+ transporter
MKGALAFLTVLFVMPLGHALTVLALKLPVNGQLTVIGTGIVTALILIYITKYIKSPAWETFIGMIAGVLLWASL